MRVLLNPLVIQFFIDIVTVRPSITACKTGLFNFKPRVVPVLRKSQFLADSHRKQRFSYELQLRATTSNNEIPRYGLLSNLRLTCRKRAYAFEGVWCETIVPHDFVREDAHGQSLTLNSRRDTLRGNVAIGQLMNVFAQNYFPQIRRCCIHNGVCRIIEYLRK